jgi:4-amino-4-deoxy-L-arabinose transferase-like glycosyltransferase
VVNKKLLLLILCCSILLLIAGFTSELSLGDEVLHYRFAKGIFNSGRRIVCDPLYDTGKPSGMFFISEPLWHILLALFGKLLGRISFHIAQFYHTIYYALLILFTYLFGKELYGEKQGLYSALIVATIPAVVVFSILFYLDIPATTLSVLCFLLIIKRKIFWAGIVLGLMYLTKRNSCFFVPAFLLLIFYQNRPNLKLAIKNILCFVLPSLIFIVPDFLWRENNLKFNIALREKGKEILISNVGNFAGIRDRVLRKDIDVRINEYTNSSLANPMDIVMYFGFALLIGLLIYALLRAYSKKDVILWMPVLCYFLFFCYLFTPLSDIRYLLPIMPLLAVISSNAISNFLNKKWLKTLLILLCFTQFISTAFYVRAKRQVPPEIKEGFAYLRENTPADAIVIYPEYLILELANRRFVWAGYLPAVIRDIFYSKDNATIEELLKSNNISYIAIKKSRVFDDTKSRHFGGYPKSFVEKLPKLPFLRLVFDNKEMSIWKIN